MEISLPSSGGWFADKLTSTGALSGGINISKYDLVSNLLERTGTGAFLDNFRRLRQNRFQKSFLSSPVMEYVVEEKYIRSPVEDLQRIREILQPAVSDLARCLKVSRQAIYNWQNGEQSSVNHAAKLNDLALAADMFAESGKPVSGYILKRKIVNEKNLFEVVQDGGSAIGAARLLLHIIGREASQRELLSARFAGRSASRSFDDSDLMQTNDKV
jgi:transcriptional regulator with XRE-family HTH domain